MGLMSSKNLDLKLFTFFHNYRLYVNLKRFQVVLGIKNNGLRVVSAPLL